MAVAAQAQPRGSAGRRIGVGANVALSILLVAAIVVVAQMIGFKLSQRWDMTSSGVNSLSEGTVNLLNSLDQPVRLTSLYFETDLDEEDQQRYRRPVMDLLNLYEATNRARVTADWINPMKEQEEMRKLRDRLRDLPKFKENIKTYESVIETYQTDIAPVVAQTLQDELNTIGAFSTGLSGGELPRPLAAIKNALDYLVQGVQQRRQQIEAYTQSPEKQLGAAVNELRQLYDELARNFKELANYAQGQVGKDASLSPAQLEYLRGMGNRLADITGKVEAQITRLQGLEPLRIEDLFAKMQPTSNAILVETPNDATVVEFQDVWPPRDETLGLRARFEQRGFKGEEKVTSAILRTTHQEQTAVIFVRYGGRPLFTPGFGQNPAGDMLTMQQQLEDANFNVKEWDLASSMTPPTFDPEPTRIIYVVLRPTPPPAGPFGQPSQEPPFSESHSKALLEALDKNGGRAMFLAGWMPGPFPPVPASYEFNDYLQSNWGIKVEDEVLLIQTASVKAGQYNVIRQDFFTMDEPDVTNHVIVSGTRARDLYLPWCAPLERSDKLPEGVTVQDLIVQPEKDGVWGVHNLSDYQEQLSKREYLTRMPDDETGPFTIAVAAEHGDHKIVVVSSRDFMIDQIAFARELMMGAQGLMMRSRNPGNVTLVLNSLHWLNDNTEFMNVGQPIDVSVLEIANKDTERVIQALTIFAWPALALALGGVVWLVRRR
ncbi:MAG: Gldg family protein [Phycisphaerae bacterium]|nr:Gldg family protein [Phycisphaerae bacterium]